jgi:8-oxo-dGTP pyrophosphatase MutT (NUDIX family)
VITLKTINEENLFKLIKSYYPTFEEEKKFKEDMINFFEFTSNPMDNKSKTGHFTASAFIIDDAYEYTFLLFHRKLERWLQPGGHIESDENIFEAAIREAIEETGISDLKFVSKDIFDIDVHMIPLRDDSPIHNHYDVRFLFSTSGKNTKINQESIKGKWTLIDELINTKDNSISRMAKKVKKM